MSKTPVAVEDLTYEQAFIELETIINTLEADEQTLDEVLAKFERGQELARYCADLLDKADLKTRQLTTDEITSVELSE